MARTRAWLQAIAIFYRSIAPAMLSVTAAMLWLLWPSALGQGSDPGRLVGLVLLKLGSVPVAWYLTEQARPHQYWFYFNMGVPRWGLWAGVAVLDVLLLVGLATLLQVLVS
jgi:hypothetical protein